MYVVSSRLVCTYIYVGYNRMQVMSYFFNQVKNYVSVL